MVPANPDPSGKWPLKWREIVYRCNLYAKMSTQNDEC